MGGREGGEEGREEGEEGGREGREGRKRKGWTGVKQEGGNKCLLLTTVSQ